MSNARAYYEEYGKIQNAIEGRKIKVTNKDINELINEGLKVRNEVKVEAPVVEEKEEVKVEETPISFDIEEDVTEKTEVKDFDTEPEEQTFSFAAYTAKKPEQVIDEEQEEQIKEKGDLYKGEPRTDFSKLLEDKPKEEEKEKQISESELLAKLDSASLSDESKQYKEKVKKGLEALEKKKVEEESHMNEMKIKHSEAQKASQEYDKKIADSLKNTEDAMKEISASDFRVLVKLADTDEDVRKSLDSFAALFNKFKDTRDSINRQKAENKSTIDKLQEMEKECRESYEAAVQAKKTFINEAYTKVLDVIKQDETTARKREEEAKEHEKLRELTGYKEEPVEPVNRFESLRQEAPKTVVDVKSYDFGNTEMTFGGRAA